MKLMVLNTSVVAMVSLFSFFCMSAEKGASSQSDKRTYDLPSVAIAMLHITPKLAANINDINSNTQLIANAMKQAKANGAQWVMTPELALTGYKFKSEIGIDWIQTGVDQWTQSLQQVADELDIVLFLSHLEKDPQTKLSYNTLFVINEAGKIIGRHRKINTIPGSESWSSKGTQATVVNVNNINVGLLICADAWPKEHAWSLKQQNADVILSTANWAPGLYGPGETWENRVRETGLPLAVNNRTGKEKDLDMSKSTSIVTLPSPERSIRVFEHQSIDDFLLQFSLNFSQNSVTNISKNRL